MEILPVNSLTRIVEHARHDDREQPPKRQPPRKRERFASGLIYTHDGELEEERPPKIDVLV